MNSRCTKPACRFIAELTKAKEEKIKSFDFDANEIAEAGTQKRLLHFAVEAGNFKAIKILIQKGGDINIQDAFQRSPFYHAVISKWGFQNTLHIE